MKLLLVVGVGSFIGGAGRFALTQFVHTRYPTAFPYGTFTVNVVGCLLIGAVYGLTAKENFSQEWRLFLATGVLGGFTTFSAFSVETVGMLKQGLVTAAAVYVCASVGFGLLATFAGAWVVTKVL